MNMLVTGGAGFIGSNFIKRMLANHSYKIVNLDALTYAGNLENLTDVLDDANYHFIKGDIRDAELVNHILHRHDIQMIVNFAAESHVDRSIANPETFLLTNVLGTQTLLEAAKNYWRELKTSDGNWSYKDDVKFVQISTDEVYGSLGETGYFTEQSTISPNSPYSASKAAADLLVGAYYQTYGLPAIITRCSNNYGPNQFPEKLIPLMINKLLKGEMLPVYGDGKQVRDWIHVEDHCSAIDCVLHNGEIGEVYNIGGNNEKENIDIVKYIVNYLNSSEELIAFVEDRLGHDRRYAIDNSKIQNELGWNPAYTFEQGLKLTIDWYVENPTWMESVSRQFASL